MAARRQTGGASLPYACSFRVLKLSQQLGNELRVDRLGVIDKAAGKTIETLLESDTLLSPLYKNGVRCKLKEVQGKIEYVVGAMLKQQQEIESESGKLSGSLRLDELEKWHGVLKELSDDYVPLKLGELMPNKTQDKTQHKDGITADVWVTELRDLLTYRKKLCSELSTRRKDIDEVQNKRSKWITLEGIDDMLRRLCAFQHDPADCAPSLDEYLGRLYKAKANNDKNSVHMSRNSYETACENLMEAYVVSHNLGPLLPDYFKKEGLKLSEDMTPLEVAIWRSGILKSLTYDHDLEVATSPHYEYKYHIQTDLRMHPAVLALEDDNVRQTGMIACLSQVLADRQHNILSPLLAQSMLETLAASTVRMEAPSGIPTIKQTPKTTPDLTAERLLELLDEDVRPRWRCALGMDAGRVATVETGEIGAVQPLRTGYTAAKQEEELLLLLTHAHAMDRG